MASSAPAEVPPAGLSPADRSGTTAPGARPPGVWRAALVGLWLLLCGAALPAQAGTAQVAVASNFAGTLAALAPGFEAATGHRLQVSAGPTGRLGIQIAAGAPFQVLLAADQATPARLEAAGHAVPGTRFTYAVGQLVLWSRQPGLVDPQGAVLAHGRFSHLAIANPKLAPYGAAAMAVLQARGLADRLAPRLVTAESIAQAHAFVRSGNAELGFVAWSQLVAPGQVLTGSYWRVPAALHPPIRQDAVLLAPGRGQAAPQALLAYLKTPAAQALIRAQGYAGPRP